AKPNGHRLHWRRFYPEDLREIVLDLRSSTGNINALIHAPSLAWEKSLTLDHRLSALPYLDDLGQVRAVDWPGKSKDLKQARSSMQKELRITSQLAKKRKIGKYGGWSDGPKMNGTGRFRTQKINGKWWLIDPEGYLFFSVGSCLTGWRAETSAAEKRSDNEFFSYLPRKNDYLRWSGIRKIGGKNFVNFPAMNYQRYFGEGWQKIVKQGIHDRMRSWGVNTLGCWSDESLQKDQKTSYTLISSIWWQQNGHRKFPSPFRENFQRDLEESLRKLAWAKEDPFCLGIFIGNELEWPDRIGETIQKL
ncbi:MAG TPA: hypothetical protein DCW45_09375, partial [Opitutae bacterium]|nr:hypothetical protein [Opitutae bacterium]